MFPACLHLAAGSAMQSDHASIWTQPGGRAWAANHLVLCALRSCMRWCRPTAGRHVKEDMHQDALLACRVLPIVCA